MFSVELVAINMTINVSSGEYAHITAERHSSPDKPALLYAFAAHIAEEDLRVIRPYRGYRYQAGQKGRGKAPPLPRQP